MEQKRDLYEVLGLSKEASAKQIKDTFRELAFKFHPDRNKESNAEERFKEIAAAYAVLSDPEKKRQYDLHGLAGIGDVSQEDLFGGINFEEIFGDFGLGGFDFGPSLFGKLFGQRTSHSNKGEDLQITIAVPLSKVFTGGVQEVRLPEKNKCESCQGSGAASGTQPLPCEECKGSGKKVATHTEGNVKIQNIGVCKKCFGQGFIIKTPCASCKGSGETIKEKVIQLTIPKGIEEGTILKVTGHGRPAKDAHGIAGDLLVIVNSQLDSTFQRSGSDLWCSATIPVYDAVLGSKIIVPTLKDNITVSIPKGTQSQTSLRVIGKGLPNFNRPGHGDMYIVVEVKIPFALKEKEKKLYEELRSIAKGSV